MQLFLTLCYKINTFIINGHWPGHGNNNKLALYADINSEVLIEETIECNFHIPLRRRVTLDRDYSLFRNITEQMIVSYLYCLTSVAEPVHFFGSGSADPVLKFRIRIRAAQKDRIRIRIRILLDIFLLLKRKKFFHSIYYQI